MSNDANAWSYGEFWVLLISTFLFLVIRVSLVIFYILPGHVCTVAVVVEEVFALIQWHMVSGFSFFFFFFAFILVFWGLLVLISGVLGLWVYFGCCERVSKVYGVYGCFLRA